MGNGGFQAPQHQAPAAPQQTYVGGGGAAQSRPAYGGAGGGYANPSPSASPAKLVTPIASINPYQNRWVIKARVMAKHPMRYAFFPSGLTPCSLPLPFGPATSSVVQGGVFCVCISN